MMIDQNWKFRIYLMELYLDFIFEKVVPSIHLYQKLAAKA